MEQLALRGGPPVRQRSWPAWPEVGMSDRQLVLEALESGVWGLGGTKIPRFEEAFARYQHTAYAVAAANGTVTLEMALHAVGVGPGSEVIIPAYTFIATASVVFQVGAVPVIVDIEPDTCTIDPAAVEAAITPRTSAIIAVHVGGGPADMDRLMAIAQKHHLPLIEDAAQAHGAEWRGRRLGSWGICGSFSFQSSKNLTCGEGGAIVTNDEALADYCRAYRNAGRWVGRTPPRPLVGADYRLTELQAALLLAQMERLDVQTERRNANAACLSAVLADLNRSTGEPVAMPPRRDERVTRHAYHLYLIRLRQDVWRVPLPRIVQALQAEGIPARTGYPALYHDPLWAVAMGSDSGRSLAAEASRQPAVNRVQPSPVEAGQEPHWRVEGGRAPQAERAAAEVIWLPQRLLLAERADMQDVAEAIAKVWRHRLCLGN